MIETGCNSKGNETSCLKNSPTNTSSVSLNNKPLSQVNAFRYVFYILIKFVFYKHLYKNHKALLRSAVYIVAGSYCFRLRTNMR